jgi:predicted 3-demethylubiquinone-9 3-methyltransferase (glyoxalase superfamily)
MQVIQKITPCLWFDDQAEEAVELGVDPPLRLESMG